MVGRPEEYAPTNQEYWEGQYDGEEDVQEAVSNAEALFHELFSDEDYGLMEDIPKSALRSAGDVVHQVCEKDDDARVTSSGFYNDKPTEEPVGSEVNGDEAVAEYKAALENVEDAVKAIWGEGDPFDFSESHPMDNIGQNGVTRR